MYGVKAKVFKTQTHSLEQLLRPNSLSPNNPSHQISQTIQDAMHVVALLRERYLWVDSLCIVQDDDQTKHDQINGMASIIRKCFYHYYCCTGFRRRFWVTWFARSVTAKNSYPGKFQDWQRKGNYTSSISPQSPLHGTLEHGHSRNIYSPADDSYLITTL